jgi:hypothetical protein
MKSLGDIFYRFFESTIPNPNYRLAVAVLVITLILFSTLLLVPNVRLRRQRANIALAMVIIALLVMLLAVSVSHRWQWIVGLLPTLMVGYQLFYLWLYHPTETPDRGTSTVPPGQTPQAAERSKTWAQKAIDNNFNLRTLFTRYGLPAVLLGVTGIVITDLMVEPQNYFSAHLLTDNADAATMIMRGIRLGAVGAYVYVLLQLGSRTFRHDVTGTVAMWCWVTLVLGPVLAGAVALLWRATPPTDGASWWGVGVVLFFTGFAPRRVIAAIEQAASELLKIGPTSVVQPRVIPLTQIRGIGPQIEERLSEEGITDATLLASAEPVRLMRNTPFDMRQILSWIDEAILIVTLPRSWQALEEEGITGAMDLATYYDQVADLDTGLLRPATPAMQDLAAKAKLSYENLAAAIKRLNFDRQVQTIWALYNNFTEFGGGDPRNVNGFARKPQGDESTLVGTTL